jgi:hypothetical protein
MNSNKIESDLSSILVISPSIDEEELISHENSHLSLQAENQTLKRQCEALKLRLENFTKVASSPLANENSDPKDEFVDVNCLVIFEKIEAHLKEANRIFTDNSKYKEAFVYLVKNFWSLTAYMYSDSNLHQAKHLRDELLKKIEQIDLSNITNTTTSSIMNQSGFETSSSMSPLSSSMARNDGELFSSMNIDIELLQNCKTTTDSLQARLVEQNNMLKSFIKDMEEKNFEEEKAAKLEKLKSKLSNENSSKLSSLNEEVQRNDKELKIEKTETEDDENFSPGSSPSSFFMKKFDRLLRNSQKSDDVSTMDNEESTGTIMESQGQNEVQPPPVESSQMVIIRDEPSNLSNQNTERNRVENSSNSTLSQPPIAGTRENERKDGPLYITYVDDGDYIGVSNTLELDPNRENESAANNRVSDQDFPKIQQSNVENHVMYEEINNSVGYKCPKVSFFIQKVLIWGK